MFICIVRCSTGACEIRRVPFDTTDLTSENHRVLRALRQRSLNRKQSSSFNQHKDEYDKHERNEGKLWHDGATNACGQATRRIIF